MTRRPLVGAVPKRRVEKGDRRIAAGRDRLDCREQIGNVVADRGPARGRKLDDGKLPSRQVLLVADVLVVRDQHRVAVCFGGPDQVAVTERCPAALRGMNRLMQSKQGVRRIGTLLSSKMRKVGMLSCVRAIACGQMRLRRVADPHHSGVR